jgi:hypothetical protein
MQKYVKEGKAVKVNDLRRWPFDFKAVEFLLKTISATSIERLIKVSKD